MSCEKQRTHPANKFTCQPHCHQLCDSQCTIPRTNISEEVYSLADPSPLKNNKQMVLMPLRLTSDCNKAQAQLWVLLEKVITSPKFTFASCFGTIPPRAHAATHNSSCAASQQSRHGWQFPGCCRALGAAISVPIQEIQS